MSRIAEATDILNSIKPKNRLEEAEMLLNEVNKAEPAEDSNYQQSLQEAISQKPVINKPSTVTTSLNLSTNPEIEKQIYEQNQVDTASNLRKAIRPDVKPNWWDTVYQNTMSGMLESGKQLTGLAKVPYMAGEAAKEAGEDISDLVKNGQIRTRLPKQTVTALNQQMKESDIPFVQAQGEKADLEQFMKTPRQIRELTDAQKAAETFQGIVGEKSELGSKAQQYVGKVIQSIPPVVSAQLLGGPFGNSMAPFIALAGSSYMRDAEQKGMTSLQQLAYGTIMGAIEGGTEYVALGKNLETIFAKGGKEGLLAWLKSMPENAVQEVLSDIGNRATMQAVTGKMQPRLTSGELGESAALGAGTAALLGGPGAIAQMRQGQTKTGISPQNVIDQLSETVDETERLTPLDTPEIIKARKELTKIKPTIEINTPERQALRQQVAEKLYNSGPINKNKEAYIVIGSPGSGKSSVIAEPIANERGALLIDSDIAKRELPEFEGGKNSGAVHAESSEIAERITVRAISNGDNIVLPMVGRTKEKLQKIIEHLKNNGYSVHLKYVDVDPTEAAQRAIKRRQGGEQGFVDPDYVLNSVGLKPKENYDILKLGKGVDSYEAYSNRVPRGQAPILTESSSKIPEGDRGRRMGGRYNPGIRESVTGEAEAESTLGPSQNKEAVSLSSEKPLVKPGESDIISSNEKLSSIPGRDSSGTPSQSSLSKLDERIKQTETKAAAVTDRNLKDVGPKLGLVNNPLPGLPKTKRLDSGYSFSDLEIEKEWRQSHGITKPSAIEKVKDFMTDLKHKATREYVHLPRTAEFAQLRNDLLKLAKQKNVSGDRAVRFLQAEIVRLDPKSMGLFERSVLINDLAAEAEKDNPSLPPGFTPGKIFSEKRLKDEQVEGDLRVKEALKLRKQINDSIIADYIQAMDAVGFDVKDKFKNEDYFRHQVLEYANVKGLVGAGKKLKTPTNRGTLKHRSGYGGSINTNYLEAEYEVLAQMLEDIEIAKTIKSVQENYDISVKVKQEAKNKKLDDWRDAIPEGYVAWQPRQGNAFFMVDSIPAKLASQLTEGLLEEIGVTKDDLRRSLVVGGLRKEFIVKEEVANTLDELVQPKADGVLKQFRKTITAAWKVNALFNPRRLIKYNFRNISSDAEWTAIGNPKAFLKTPQATKDLYETIIRNKSMSPEMREWFQRGGMDSTMYVQELGELNKLKVFEHLFKKYPDITKVPKNAWERYWKAAATGTQFREAILRYSNYLEYLGQMQSSPEGKPKNFGASIPEEVMAIKDIRDRAFWMSNDLSGAYDRVSALGQEIRSQLYPFWSFVEINFKRYIQYIKNQARDGKLAGAVGKQFIRTAPRVAFGTGKAVIKMTAFWTMLQAYNYLRFRDEEEELPPDVQSRPHIVFGRHKDGRVIYFDRLGSLGDFLEWFGLDEAPGLVKDFLNGQKSIKDIAIEMAKSPVNKVIGGMSPFYKLLPEVLMEKQLYPDAFKPGRIRDLGVYLAKQFGLENEYKEVMGLPTRGYGKSAEGSFWYSVEPKEAAYYAILDEKQRFQKKVGKYQEGYSESARSNALYNLKLAMRYGDKRATNKYLQEYVKLGGTAKGFDRSLKSLNPLYGLGKNKKPFVESLNSEQKKQLEMAKQFYEEIIVGKKELKNEIIKLRKTAQ